VRRELIVVHIAEVHHNEFVDELDPGWAAQGERFNRESAADLAAWTERQGLTGARRLTLTGSPVELLLELIDQEHPALLVLGSRRLTTTERLYTTSTASTVAAYAACPVAVVPPT
jgi:nucleotide-binding universal stress UspA family protein